LSSPEEIEERVGHPFELWESLKERVQAESLKEFAQVQDNWLNLMWAYDAFRIAKLLPRNTERYLGRRKPFKDVGGFYRTKGNLFALLIALLLQNRTSQEIGARTRVQGFSQPHQIDVAWPKTKEGVLQVAAETKVMGAPPYVDTPARGALSDYTNRRKELKFAATDLKLYRRQQGTAIRHWGVWRQQAPPKTYFLWAARLKTEGRKPDSVAQMVKEARALIDTYLDGAGIFAWKPVEDGLAYQPVDIPFDAQVTKLDDVLHAMESHIRILVEEHGGTPTPEVPGEKAIDAEELVPDEDS
jgi:hypothetical protein